MVDVRQGIAAITCKGRLILEVIVPNVQIYNYRGGSVASISGEDRQDPSYMTHHSAAIDYRGLLKMCCNIYSDYATHAPYVIGSLREHSFLELWLSNTMQNLRAAHLKADWYNSSVCSRCTTYLPKVKIESLELVTERNLQVAGEARSNQSLSC
jgi:Iron-sulfur cluster-binding domain